MRTVAGGVPPRPPRPLGASFHYVSAAALFSGGGLRTVAGGVPPRPPRPLGASFHYVFVGGGFFFFFVFRVGRGVPLPWLLRAAWALAAGGGVLVPCLPAVDLLPTGGRVAGSLEYQVEGVFAVVEKEVGVSDEADILSEVCAVFPNFSGLLAYCCY